MATTGNKKDKTFPMQIISMNVNGPNAGKGSASSRRKYIADVVLANKPHILLIQEFQWKRIRGKTWEATPLPDQYAYTGNEQASVLYDTSVLNDTNHVLKTLKQRDLQAPLDNLKRTGKISNDFSPFARACIRVLEPKEQNSSDAFKILIVSWHGVYKCTDEEKQEQFENLKVYLAELSAKEGAAILLGGDFNFDISQIEIRPSDDFILHEYTPSARRGGKVIDYFMTSSELDLTDVKHIDLAEMRDPETALDPYNVLDHDPVSATVARRTPIEDKTIPVRMCVLEGCVLLVLSLLVISWMIIR